MKTTNVEIGDSMQYHLPDRANYIAERTQDGDRNEVDSSAARPPLSNFVHNPTICRHKSSVIIIHPIPAPDNRHKCVVPWIETIMSSPVATDYCSGQYRGTEASAVASSGD